MIGNGMPLCRAFNADCRDDPACPSFGSGVPCWSTNDVSCCRRNDKSRCCFCSVYLNFLGEKETGMLFRTQPESLENESFKRMSIRCDQSVKSGEYVEVS
jgi:hypothetical protein